MVSNPPALVDLTEVLADLLRQTDAFRDPLRDLAVPRENGNVHLRALGKTAFHRLGQFLRRRAGELSRDGPDEDFDEFRPVTHVDVMKLSAQGDLIAPSRRQQVRVGIAPDKAQQCLMIDGAACKLVEARNFGEPHRQNAGSQREIPRVPRGQVRCIGQRHQKVSASNR